MPDAPLKYCLYVRNDLAALKTGFFDAREFYGMRSDLYMYKALRDFLKTKNILLETQATHRPEESDVIICLNETDFFTQYKRTPRNRRLLLILSEPPVYNAKDWQHERHQLFDQVFTFNADLLLKDKNKYVKLTYPIDFSVERLQPPGFLQKKHSCMIAAAFAITRSKSNPESLLYERYKVLRWYHRHAQQQLDYFARTRPDQKFRHFRGAALLTKISPGSVQAVGRRLYEKNLKSLYKGPVPGLSKNQTLGAYKFNFCFENSTGLKGYITEKLFDCFFSGTVPVYYGAPDIEQHVPKSCYIAFTDFNSMEKLQLHLAQLDENTYLHYLANAAEFLNSPAAAVFSTDRFIETIYSHTQP